MKASQSRVSPDVAEGLEPLERFLIDRLARALEKPSAQGREIRLEGPSGLSVALRIPIRIFGLRRLTVALHEHVTPILRVHHSPLQTMVFDREAGELFFERA